MSPWFWSWIVLVVVFTLGEAVTGGLLVLPWAIGAATAAVLDATGAGATAQWLAFVIVSSVLLVIAQRFIVRRK